MSATSARRGRRGTRGSSGAPTTTKPGVGVDLGRVELGDVERERRGQAAEPLAPRNARPGASAAASRTSAGSASSASPMKNASMNGASGSGWVAVGPPARTSGPLVAALRRAQGDARRGPAGRARWCRSARTGARTRPRRNRAAATPTPGSGRGGPAHAARPRNRARARTRARRRCPPRRSAGRTGSSCRGGTSRSRRRRGRPGRLEPPPCRRACAPPGTRLPRNGRVCRPCSENPRTGAASPAGFYTADRIIHSPGTPGGTRSRTLRRPGGKPSGRRGP